MMKKFVFLAAALVAMAACTSDDYLGNGSNPVSPDVSAIAFNSSSAATTRADHTGSVAAGLLNNNFVVHGVKSDGTVANQVVVFNNYNVNYVNNSAYTTTSNTANWDYVGQTKHPRATGIAAQSIKYWDYAQSQYDFIAYSKGEATAVYADGSYNAASNILVSAIDATKMNGVITSGNITDGAYTIQGKAANLAKTYIADMVTAYADNDYNKTVQFKFRSLSAKVRVGLYETVTGYSVKDVVFYTAASTKATDNKAHLFTTGTDVFNQEGTVIVYYPTTGSGNKSNSDYNKAHVAFKAETSGTTNIMDFGALDATNGYVAKEVAETSSTEKLYIGRASNKATFAGDNSSNYYTIVIPNEDGAVLNLKVDYTLVSTDGSGETIKVTGATAQVPAVYAAWKSGYAYTYIFKISDNTNGATNPALGPAGLYPITFDAVVTETEDGIQETITTVSDYSITTFGYNATNKAYVNSTNEYKFGNKIYAVIMYDGNVLEPNLYNWTHVYKVESSDPNYPITEASVAEAMEKSSVGTKKITYTHKCDIATAKTSIPGADGNMIAINAVELTPTETGYLVIQFRHGVTWTEVTGLTVGDPVAEGYYRQATGSSQYIECATTETVQSGYTYYTQTVAGNVYKVIKID